MVSSYFTNEDAGPESKLLAENPWLVVPAATALDPDPKCEKEKVLGTKPEDKTFLLKGFLLSVVIVGVLIYSLQRDMNLDEPESLTNQSTLFNISTPDGAIFQAWHTLPVSLGLAAKEPADSLQRVLTHLRRSNTRVALYFDSPFDTRTRSENFLTISAALPNIHILRIADSNPDDFSTKAQHLSAWATESAEVSPTRIMIFADSLGTMAAIRVVCHLEEVSGMVFVDPFLPYTTPLAGKWAAIGRFLMRLERHVRNPVHKDGDIQAAISSCSSHEKNGANIRVLNRGSRYGPISYPMGSQAVLKAFSSGVS